jgi:hypothetical protein
MLFSTKAKAAKAKGALGVRAVVVGLADER